jgi:hypothetical protein
MRVACMRVARWFLFVAVCAVALARAITSRATPPPNRADGSTRAIAFTQFVGQEAAYRKEAAKDFPTDPWSQDDFFHAREAKEARAFAKTAGIPITDALDALDEGLRAQRARGDRSSLSTVPPCHPRAIY